MPSHVSYFEKLLYASAVLSVISVFLSYDTMFAEAGEKDPAPQIFLIGMVVTLAAWVVLIVLAARGRKNWARWMLTIGIVFSITSGFGMISDAMSAGTFSGIVSGLMQIAVMGMKGAAVYFVFSGDAPAWFHG